MAVDLTIHRRGNDQLTNFITSFPTDIYFKETELVTGRRVFWTQSESNNSTSADDDNNVSVHEKIKSAFSDIHVSRLKGLIQFWVPGEIDGFRLLSALDQPFVLEDLDPRLCKYRLFCVKKHYSIDDVYNNIQVEDDDDDDDDIMITPATAFTNLFPEIIVDLRVNKGNSFVDCALDCKLTSSILLPVFNNQKSSSSCVGVVECCMRVDGIFIVFNELKHALERVGLHTYGVPECLPYKTIPQFNLSTLKIEEAIKFVCESHELTLGQAWIAIASDNPGPISSSLEDPKVKKGMRVVKFSGYLLDDVNHSDSKDYYDTCNVLPLKMGEGLVGMALQTFEPHFCTNLSKFKRVRGFLGVLSRSIKCSSLVICLRSIHTGDTDYALEFLWPKSRNYLIVLESVLLTLKLCLPRFKLASGAQLGDELCIVDVETSTGSETGSFKILERNRRSQIPKVLEQRRRSVQGTLMEIIEEAASNLNERQQSKIMKRKLSDLSESESESETEPGSFFDEDNDILIATFFKDERTLILLKSSYTIANAKDKIEEEFKLDPETYMLEYEIEGDRDMLDTDENLATCKQRWRIARMRNPHKGTLKVHVLPST